MERVRIRSKTPQPWFRMERLSPAFCRTLRPGLAIVPAAEAVMVLIRKSSSAATPKRRAMSSAARWWKSRRMRPARAWIRATRRRWRAIPAGATLAPGQNALRPALGRPDPVEAGGHRHHLARGQGERRCHAPVDAKSGAEVLQRLALNLAGKRYVPSVRPARDGRVLDRALDRAGIAELHPADLRQADGAPLPVQAAGLNFATGEAEGVADALFARGWVAGASCAEVPEGAVQVAKGLLLAGNVDGPDPVELGPKIGQLSGLGDVVEPLSGLPLVVPPPIPALFQREVVDEAADARELAEQSFLFSGRAE